MSAKYNVGDTVRLKSWAEMQKSPGEPGLMDDMKRFAGTEQVVKESWPAPSGYIYRLTGSSWSWGERWIDDAITMRDRLLNLSDYLQELGVNNYHLTVSDDLVDQVKNIPTDYYTQACVGDMVLYESRRIQIYKISTYKEDGVDKPAYHLNSINHRVRRSGFTLADKPDKFDYADTVYELLTLHGSMPPEDHCSHDVIIKMIKEWPL